MIVCKFFKDAYTTPFGYSFLPQPFYHSLSSMAYAMFYNCYLKKAIFVNKHSLDIEHKMKMGGCTGTNSNCFGIGVFIDENSYYPGIMQNEMPVEYEIPDEDPYKIFEPPLLITEDDDYKELISPVDIYCISFKFPEDTVIPMISQKTKDTLVIVRESTDFDTKVDHTTANTSYVFGYTIIASLEEIPGTKFRIFGHIAFKRGDKIFKEFIED